MPDAHSPRLTHTDWRCTAAERKQQCKRLVLASAPYGVSSMEGCVAAVTVPKERHILLVAARPHPVPLVTLALPADLQHPLWALTSLGHQRLALTACPPGQPALVVLVQVSVVLVQVSVILVQVNIVLVQVSVGLVPVNVVLVQVSVILVQVVVVLVQVSIVLVQVSVVLVHVRPILVQVIVLLVQVCIILEQISVVLVHVIVVLVQVSVVLVQISHCTCECYCKGLCRHCVATVQVSVCVCRQCTSAGGG